eukprot:gene11806-8117_t
MVLRHCNGLSSCLGWITVTTYLPLGLGFIYYYYYYFDCLHRKKKKEERQKNRSYIWSLSLFMSEMKRKNILSLLGSRLWPLRLCCWSARHSTAWCSSHSVVVQYFYLMAFDFPEKKKSSSRKISNDVSGATPPHSAVHPHSSPLTLLHAGETLKEEVALSDYCLRGASFLGAAEEIKRFVNSAAVYYVFLELKNSVRSNMEDDEADAAAHADQGTSSLPHPCGPSADGGMAGRKLGMYSHICPTERLALVALSEENGFTGPSPNEWCPVIENSTTKRVEHFNLSSSSHIILHPHRCSSHQPGCGYLADVYTSLALSLSLSLWFTFIGIMITTLEGGRGGAIRENFSYKLVNIYNNNDSNSNKLNIYKSDDTHEKDDTIRCVGIL